jgi:predicted GNAT family N-acyltransferase
MSDIANRVVINQVRNQAAMQECWALRRKVFIEEQGVPEVIEVDEDDTCAYHVLATCDGAPVGCGRMVSHGDAAKIGRMAVLPGWRRHGIGRLIIDALHQAASAQGYRKAVLHAQLHAEGFYLKCAYIPVGEAFEEAGIPHRLMERNL